MTSPTQSAANAKRSASGLRPQDRRALLRGAILLVVIFGYALVVRPTMARLVAQREQLQEEQTSLARERALVASVRRLPRARDSIASQLKVEAPRLFAGDSVAAMAALTSYVTGIADGSQMRLTSVEAHVPRTAQGITTLAVDVRGEGSWRNVLTFVHSLESATRLIDISPLRIERGARGGPLGGDLVSFSATVSGYSGNSGSAP
ncbi:MAG: type II secretion system protein GspM [bacterium]